MPVVVDAGQVPVHLPNVPVGLQVTARLPHGPFSDMHTIALLVKLALRHAQRHFILMSGRVCIEAQIFSDMRVNMYGKGAAGGALHAMAPALVCVFGPQGGTAGLRVLPGGHCRA